jgi:hypothetical protein
MANFNRDPTPERLLLEQIAMSVVNVPSLFTIMPTEREGLDPRNLWSKPVKITLWCTCPGHEHPVSSASYEISLPKEWFRQVLPYLKTTLRLLQLLPIVKGVATHYHADEVASQVEMLEALCHSTEIATENQSVYVPPQNESALAKPSDDGPADRAVKKLLLTLGETNSFAPLRRVISDSGILLWLCPEHYENARATVKVDHDDPQEAKLAPASKRAAERPIYVDRNKPYIPQQTIKLRVDASSIKNLMSEVGLSDPDDAFYVCADFPEERREFFLVARERPRKPYLGYVLWAAPEEPILFSDASGIVHLMEYRDGEVRLWDVSYSQWAQTFADLRQRRKTLSIAHFARIGGNRSRSSDVAVNATGGYVDLTKLVAVADDHAFEFQNTPVAARPYLVLVNNGFSGMPCVGSVLSLGLGGVILLRDQDGKMCRIVGQESTVRVADAPGYTEFFGMLQDAHRRNQGADHPSSSLT